MGRLPGALAMYGLSLGISRISETLPSPVYALLSGLNAGTVGIILLAAVHLSEKAITDKLSRAIVIGAGAAGMLYTALWYFPVLMVAGGGATLVWDGRWIQNGWKVTFGKKRSEEGVVEEARREEEEAREMERVSSQRQQATNISGRSVQEDGQATQRHVTHATSVRSTSPIEASIDSPSSDGPRPEAHSISWKSGLLILAAFFTSFITIMVLRSILTSPPLGLQLFSSQSPFLFHSPPSLSTFLLMPHCLLPA